MRIKIVVNPVAGRGRARRWLASAVRSLVERGAEVEVVESRGRDHLIEIGRSASNERWDRVVACGGDGTLHLLIRDMNLQRVTLGILPSGSGDDFARLLGIPHDPEIAAEYLFSETVREVDVASANGIRFLGVASVGFDAEVARYAHDHARFLRGSAIYLYSIFRVLPRFRPHRVIFERDGDRQEVEMMFAAIGNSSRYGGGIQVVPPAMIDDGLLDVCLVERCSKLDLLRTLPLAYSGKHITRPYVSLLRGRRFRFESEEHLEVFADGEPVTTTPVTLDLEKERLRIVVP
ncbi:MAG TPA: diacylglycerol kinase family protein [Thermoanaerobaculia bacterium]|nr:diacylglycerol kinase family protein [Thermoanaerobaculia bacterium]